MKARFTDEQIIAMNIESFNGKLRLSRQIALQSPAGQWIEVVRQIWTAC